MNVLRPVRRALAAIAPLCAGPALADDRLDRAFVVHQYGLNDGLPQASVTDVVLDATGRIWVTTFGGLSSFDGVDFESYDMAVESAFPSNRFVSAVATDDGTLWFGTEGAGLVRRSKQGDFRAVALPPPLNDRIVWDLSLGEDGSVWAAVELGLAHLRRDGVIEVFLAPPEAGLGDLVSVAATWRGVLVGTTHQLLRFDGEGFEPLLSEGSSFGATWGLGQDQAGAIWGGGPSVVWRWSDEGVQRWANGSWNLRFAEGAGGVVWWPDGDRLMRYDPKSGMERTAPVEGLPTETRALFRDFEGSLWVGSVDRGLFQLEPRRMERWSDAKGAGTSAVLPVAETRDGAVWTGGSCGPLLRWGPEGAVEVELPGAAGALPEVECLRELVVDQAGDLLVFGPRDVWRVRHDVSPPQAEQWWSGSPADPELRTAIISPDGDVLVSRAGEELMVLVDSGLEGRKLRPYGGPALPRSRAGVALAFGPDGALWAGAEGELVRVHDGERKRWTTAENLPPGQLRALRVLGPELAWVGSYGGGLGLVQGDRVRRVTTRDGLVENIISAIIPADDGGLWLNGNRGVSRVAPAEVQRFLASGAESLPADLYIEGEGNGGTNAAGLRARDGRVMLPSIDGLRVIHHEPEPEHPALRVVFDGLRVGGVAIPIGDGRVQISSGGGDLEATFHARSFIGGQNRRFQYRLKGYERRWNDAGRARSARYTNLPPGHYELELQLQTDTGRWIETDARLQIEVLPAWHQRTWVRLSAAALFLGALALGWKLRTRSLRLRYQQLQEELGRRAAAERLAREREERYRSVFEHAHNGFLLHRRGGGVVDANARAAQVLGRSKAELIAGPDLDFVAPEHRAAYRRLIDEVLEGGPASLDFKGQRQSAGVQAPFYLFADARPHSSHGEATVLVALDDRSERAQREEERNLLQKQTQQAHKLEAVGRLAGGVAHDFNNELTAILLQATVLRDQLSGTPSIEVVNELEASALRAAEVTRGLLTFSRGQALSAAPTALFAHCRSMETVLGRFSSGRSDVRLIFEAPKAEVWVLADPTQLGQTLVNLVINAFDALVASGQVTVRVGAVALGRGSPGLPPELQPGGFGFLEVEDNGPGMSAEVQARAFEPFFTTKDVGHGTGLGLAQVHGIAKQSGGFIELQTAPGAGCRLRVYFPAAAAEPGQQGARVIDAPRVEPLAAVASPAATEGHATPPAHALQPASEGDDIQAMALDAQLLEQLVPRRKPATEPGRPPVAPDAPPPAATPPTPTPSAAQPAEAPPAGAPPSPDPKQTHILVCDDNDAVLRAARIALRREGFQVTAVPGPIEALSALHSGEERFALLLTDIRMPDMDGTELARAVRRFMPELPVLFMSGYSDVRVDAADQGWLVSKPFTPSELVDRVYARLAAGA